MGWTVRQANIGPGVALSCGLFAFTSTALTANVSVPARCITFVSVTPIKAVGKDDALGVDATPSGDFLVQTTPGANLTIRRTGGNLTADLPFMLRIESNG